MKKKWFAILMTAVMTVTMLPVAAWGDEIPFGEAAGEEIFAEEAAPAEESAPETADTPWDPAGMELPDEGGVEALPADGGEAELNESVEVSPVNGAIDISQATVKWGKPIYRVEYMNYYNPGGYTTIDGKSPDTFKPTFTLTYNGKTLKEGTDYTAEYNMGVLVTGINAYTGNRRLYPPTTGYYSFAGKNRYETAVKIIIGCGAFNPRRIVVVTGEDYPDALAANAYAGINHNPLVLVKRNDVPPAVETMLKDEYIQKNCKEIVVIGGKMDGAIKELKTLVPNATITTIAGKNRYETAEKVTRQFLLEKFEIPYSSNTEKVECPVFVTTGQAPADALAASTWSYSLGIPVILAKDGKVSGGAAKVLNHFETVYLLGDTKVVKDSVVPTGVKKVRLGGKNRWETSRKIADFFIVNVTNNHDYMTLYVPGEDALFPDALAAGQFNPIGPNPVILVSEKRASCYLDPTYKQVNQSWPGFFFGSAAKDHGPKGRVGTIYKAVAKNIDTQLVKQMNSF